MRADDTARHRQAHANASPASARPSQPLAAVTVTGDTPSVGRVDAQSATAHKRQHSVPRSRLCGRCPCLRCRGRVSLTPRFCGLVGSIAVSALVTAYLTVDLMLPEAPPCALARSEAERVAMLGYLAVQTQAAAALTKRKRVGRRAFQRITDSDELASAVAGGAPGIQSYAIFGTLLGAVRDSHILPWTADVDITLWQQMMGTFDPRPDDGRWKAKLSGLGPNRTLYPRGPAAAILAERGLAMREHDARFARVCVATEDAFANSTHGTQVGQLFPFGRLDRLTPLEWWWHNDVLEDVPYADLYGLKHTRGTKHLHVYGNKCVYDAAKLDPALSMTVRLEDAAGVPVSVGPFGGETSMSAAGTSMPRMDWEAGAASIHAAVGDPQLPGAPAKFASEVVLRTPADAVEWVRIPYGPDWQTPEQYRSQTNVECVTPFEEEVEEGDKGGGRDSAAAQ